MNKVRWGIIGVGDVCEVKSAPAMQLVENSELVAVMRRSGHLAEDYARRHNVPRWYDDADALINDPDINAIYIATPPDGHLPYTLKAAAAGKPVYVEKPMARTYNECQQMIAACEHAKVPLLVAYYRRYLPNFLQVKQWLEQKKIGDVRQVNVRLVQAANPQVLHNIDKPWRVDPQIAGGGYFYDLASHQLDLLDFLIGPIINVSGFRANQAGLYQAEDSVVASWQFKNGVLGSGNWCFCAAQSEERDLIQIIGSEGQIEFPVFGSGQVTLKQLKHKPQLVEFDLPKHIQQPLIDAVVKQLLTGSACNSTGDSAARTNWVMQQIV
ncbi:Gfo/Idh/MocA family protein [Neptunicella marina]|uniref:Gfo/Idh/MocA family protein n=1 Tax=Neptunicella marina TaxID=2125989 RepID=UPI0019D62946